MNSFIYSYNQSFPRIYSVSIPETILSTFIFTEILLPRFYDKTLFEEEGVEHVKIKCAGFGSAPNKEQVNKFVSICKMFWTKNPLKVIGVHCTHGFNRTGYMIISYLVREQSVSVEAAFQLFKASREPG